MSPWASKPGGPVALGNVANQGSTLAVRRPSPFRLRTAVAKKEANNSQVCSEWVWGGGEACL